ncbi:hypothetical protein [Acetivibrio clariflavus]|uniref:hypothetical protein n=1 Tax=Acetivibrio clariflavus TaxID=288965 RepID=UPI0004B23435|nr:hypothetical protein [Acetivibrio clariflavus]
MKGTEKSDKIPEDLEKIENSIEKIINVLEGPAVTIKSEEDQGKNKAGQSPKPKSNEKEAKEKSNEEEPRAEEKSQEYESESKEKKNTEEQKNSEGSDSEKGAAQKDPWQEISSITNQLHYEWNAYIPSAMKKNAGKDLIDKFDNSLNNLTSNAVTKDKNKTLLAANELYQYIPDFYMLYKTPSSPEIKRIRYYIRNAVLNASILNWDQARKDIENLKSSWAIYKNTINAQNQDLASKLDYSIYELEKVVNESNVYLTDIKGRIAISNTESIEKAEKEMEKEKQ